MCIKIRPKKGLGQHFLKNQGVLDRITQEITEPNTVVLEIGFGTGALTYNILKNKKVKYLIAIEKDLSLFQIMDDKIKELKLQNKITIINKDILQMDITKTIVDAGFSKEVNDKSIVMLSNLPYNVGTKILSNMLEVDNIFSKIVVMLQEEVVNRMIAKPKTKEYSKLSILVQSLCEASKVMSVSSGSFNPPPKVQSAIIKLQPKSNRISKETLQILLQITKSGFSSRRKKLLKNLTALNNQQWIDIIKTKIHSNQRIEELSAQQLIDISEIIRLQTSK
ncbi:MAG: ribosomal RNA small subunit methyltransferase A [Alphaproteobacteria bacterium]|nr:ribosomal RNA small subunit methyltransferase A [Rickettsiales bacterium]